MGKPLKVLLAEDNRLQRIILSRLLESFGYDVIAAEDGAQALDLVRKLKTQILLTDYEMPKLNGVELTRKIRALNLDHYVHVIMITGRDQDETRVAAFDAGVDDFLEKGQNPVALKARMRSAERLVLHAAAVAETNRTLRETHAKLEADLQAAANAQRQLLPDINRKIHDLKITSTFMPSAIVSGDMFGCFDLGDGKMGFYAVDVSGHGVHASLLSVAIGHLVTPVFFRTLVLADPESPDLAALVRDLNQRFSASENDDYFTMFCGVVDCRAGRLDYCQAAYPSPFLASPEGAVEPLEMAAFRSGCWPMRNTRTGRSALNADRRL